jgi:predicted 3-demethylubiquinone-9 3-methyltransferase (glyoxalase superfamily)
MSIKVPRISPCLWFSEEAEEAARFYASIFPNSRIGRIAHFGLAGFEHHGRPAGSVMTVEFFLDGQCFTALNGGPIFKFTEAISLMVACKDQTEIDYYWDALSKGGPVDAQQCGWLKDKYGLSWQIVPENLADIMAGSDTVRMDRAMTALLQMKKPDVAAIERAMQG